MLEKIKEVIRQRKITSFFVLFLIATAIPLTVLMAQRVQNVQQKAAEKEGLLPQSQDEKEKYVAGEVIIKLKPQIQQLRTKKDEIQKGVDIETQALPFSALDQETAPVAIKSLNDKYQIKRVEKVFKNVQSPRQELDKLKATLRTQNAQSTAINEQEFLGIDLSRIYKLSFDETVQVEQVIKDITEEIKINPSFAPEVEYVQPNYIYKTNQAQIMPNDTHFHYLYGMHNTGQNVDTLGSSGTADADIDAPEAWSMMTGNINMVVGIIDTGVDYTHEDLAANMWTNTHEIASNNIDDDNNGYIDDVRGWDFVNNDNNPMDENGHGTHVAGTIGAVRNNGKGVSGVSWHIKLMPLRFLDASGSGSTTDAVKAIHYATMMGVKITNNSWGGGSYDQLLHDTIAEANSAGALFVAAAGNNGANNDTRNSYPASYSIPNIISVAATTYYEDQLASFSNYGKTTVHLGAPGKNILSTYISPKNSYVWLSGTSMATPHVSGALALAWEQFPSLSGQGIKAKLLATVDKVPSLAGIVISQGRLNAYNLLTQNIFAYSPQSFTFSQSSGGQNIQSQIVLTNAGNQQDVLWSIAANVPWITFSQSSGTIAKNTDQAITFFGDVSSLQSKNHTGTITITTNHPSYQIITIPVTLGVQPKITTEWQKKAGDTESDYPSSLVTDSGNIYIAGGFGGSIMFNTTTLTSVGQSDIFLVKYDSSGSVLWAKQGGGSSLDNVQKMVIDTQGNMYLVGQFVGSMTLDGTTLNGSDTLSIYSFIAKYTNDGNLVWAKKIADKNTSSRSLAVDLQGNAYIIGDFSESMTFGNTTITAASSRDIFVASYDTGGNPRWIQKTGKDYDSGIAITVDHEDNITAIYSTQYPFAYIGGNYDGIYFAKYNQNGSVIRDSYIMPLRVKVIAAITDIKNNIVLTGFFTGTPTIGSITLTNPTGLTSLFIGKFDKDGTILWAKGIPSTVGNSIQTDTQENIYITGNFSGHVTFATSPIYIALTSVNERTDAVSIKFDPSGNVVWAKQTDFSDTDHGKSLDLDNAGKIYTAGVFNNKIENQSNDIFIEKLSDPTTIPSPTPTPTLTPSVTPQPQPTDTPTPTPAPACNACTADTNKDGRVSVVDYSLMVSCYDQQAVGRCTSADINTTGQIDIEDIGCVINYFGETCSQ